MAHYTPQVLLACHIRTTHLQQIFLRLTEVSDNDEAKRLLGINDKPADEKVSLEMTDGETITVKTGKDKGEDEE